jgi:hypothetical protein
MKLKIAPVPSVLVALLPLTAMLGSGKSTQPSAS